MDRTAVAGKVPQVVQVRALLLASALGVEQMLVGKQEVLALAVVRKRAVRKRVPKAAEQVPWARPQHSIADRVQDPCTPWNRRGKLIFHNDCKRTLLEGSDGRSIGLVPGL